MRVTPRSGPVGTVISVKSVTPSPLDGDQITLVGLFAPDAEEPVIDTAVEVGEDGHWSASLVVPRSATPGDYVVFALTVNESDGLFPYEEVPFEVTSSTTPDDNGETPVGIPSDRVPSLTG